jgi:hypothetical protein
MYSISSMKINVLFILALFFVFPVFSQHTDDYYQPDSMAYFKGSPFSFGKPFSNHTITDRTQISVQAGTACSFIGKENIFSSWIAPEISYALTPRLHVSTGVLMMHGNLNNLTSFYNKEALGSRTTGFTQNYFFAKGEYLLNDRVMFTAATMHQLPAPSNNPYPSSFNSIGMDVKLTDNFSISAGCTFSRDIRINSYETPGNNLFFHSAFPVYTGSNAGW